MVNYNGIITNATPFQNERRVNLDRGYLSNWAVPSSLTFSTVLVQCYLFWCNIFLRESSRISLSVLPSHPPTDIITTWVVSKISIFIINMLSLFNEGWFLANNDDINYYYVALILFFVSLEKTSFIFFVYGVIELANLESLLEVNREVLEKRALGKLILFLVSYKADFWF